MAHGLPVYLCVGEASLYLVDGPHLVDVLCQLLPYLHHRVREAHLWSRDNHVIRVNHKYLRPHVCTFEVSMGAGVKVS